jgi:hypothetical protein
MRKNLLIIIVSCCILSLSFPSMAQNVALRKFVQNIHDFNVVFPQEKVYLQLDNTGYFQGETIWFKAYVVKASSLTKSTSGVLHVELVSPSGVVLQSQKLKVMYGQCDGAFNLVDMATKQAREMRGAVNYPSGYYEIRAYTLNMLNFSESTLFSRVVPVFTKPSKEGAFYDESPVLKETKSDIEQYRPKRENLKKLNVSFYPEGGNFVMGIPCRVAFKATDDSGSGIDVSGIIKGSSDSTYFHTQHDGMGVFYFTPIQKSNTVQFLYDGKKYNFDLPEAIIVGYTMSVKNDGKGNIEVSVQGTMPESKDSLGLTATCRGELFYFKTLAQSRNRQTIIIPASSWPSGVCQLTLFTSYGEILAKRSLFNKIDLKSPKLEFETNKEMYSPYDKVNVKFHLSDSKGAPFADRFCISVRDSRTFGTTYSEDLRTNLLLCSDLRGFINHPEYYFQSDDEEHLQALDLLMMVQGWERYDWKIMAAGPDAFDEKHRIEEGLTFNGWILKKNGKDVLSGIKVLASVVPDNKKHIDQFKFITDKNGYFGFNLTEFYGNATLTMMLKKVNSNKLANAKILLERSLNPAIRPYLNEELLFESSQVEKKEEDMSKRELDRIGDDEFPEIIDDNMGVLLDEVDINAKRKYIDYNTFTAFDVTKDTEGEYDKGEYTTDVYGYLMSKGYPIWKEDSTEGESSEEDSGDEISAEPISTNEGETAQNILQASDLWRMGNSKLIWYVHNSKKCMYQGIFEDSWTIDMDYVKSILVYDKPVPASSVLSLTPLLVSDFSRDASESLNTFSSAFVANGGNYCVVDVLLKEEYEFKSKEELLSLNKRITTVQGYSELRDFYSPSYPNGPIIGDVDYRRTLYWNPDVVSDKEGNANIEFYNNSQTRRFSISGCGITASGTPYILNDVFK